MDKINSLLDKLKNLYKQKYVQNLDVDDKIQKIEREMIHPEDGAYFAIYKKYKDKWIFADKIFLSKAEAKNEIDKENYRRKNYNNAIFDDIEIRRVVVHETDISEYL